MIKLIILLLICIKHGYNYPHGAPERVCTSMMAYHDVTPQQCQSKYIIQSDKSEFDTNDIIRINVRSLTNNDPFKGILLIAFNENNQQIVGTWSTKNSSAKTISCNETSNTGITHSSADDKFEIEAYWHTPSVLLEENIIIKATIVKSYEEIYVNCFNLTLRAKQFQNESIKADMEKDILSKTNTNVKWNYANGTVTVTMMTEQVKVGEWRSIGFSLDRQMGDEYVFICQVSPSGDALLRRMHTKLGKRLPSPTHDEVNVINTLYENGIVTCQFSFETTSVQADGEPIPITIGKNYYLIFAAGLLRTEDEIDKHNFTFVTSRAYQLQTPRNINLDETFTTSSLLTSTTSSQTDDIGVNITWTYLNGVTHIKMMLNNLKISQWFALAFSLDDFMGEDHVFVCQHFADDTISLQRFINPIGHSQTVLANTDANLGGVFNVTQQKYENGITYCDFKLANFVNIKRSRRQNNIPELSQTNSYQPLIAHGNLDSSNNLLRHSRTGRTAFSQIVYLNREETIVQNIETSSHFDSDKLMKAHGILMIFSWIVVVSTGILVARYFKRTWSNRKLCNKAIWFAIHRTLMSCAAILTIISFFLILIYKKGQWPSNKQQNEYAHSIIGIIVISFAFIQPFLALFRCNPTDKYRFIYNYLHAFVGFTAFILSIAAIFLAMFFTHFNFQLNKEWAILVTWICWLPIIFLLFEFIEIYFRKYSLTNADKSNVFQLNERNGAANSIKIETIQIENNIKQDRIKGLLLLFHIIIAFGLALALIILIGQS